MRKAIVTASVCPLLAKPTRQSTVEDIKAQLEYRDTM